MNNSATISAFDLVLIRQIILGTKTDFPENTAWRYIDASYDFPDPRNPFLEAVPEFRDYKELLINDLERDFIGFKVGDVNNSASAHSMVGLGRSNKKLSIEVAELEVQAGYEYSIPFKAKDLDQIQGYQFTIDFQPKKLKFKEVIVGESVAMNLGNFGLAQIEQGKLTTSWENITDFQTQEETVLFTLVFEGQGATNLSEALTINSSITEAELTVNTMN